MSEPHESSTKDSANDFIRAVVASDAIDGPYGGRVQTRFPPEPNGFLHIGHAKSIALNFGVAAENNGVCRLRFDDTNPETEDAGFVEAICDDVAWLGFDPGVVAYASDYFAQLAAWAEQLICAGFAYVDDQDAETISATRGDFTSPGVDSPWRNRDVAENLDLFSRMRAGEFDDGAKVLRAKIDMAHENMLMRDPVMYRIRKTSHFRTANEWKIYPTYDWAHGQCDALEGTTHSLCTLEFETHRQLYDWYMERLSLPADRPRQTEFARLNLTHTVLSKRKLAQLVSDQHVDGWDDPRMPTLRGLRRRGYPPEAIRAFCAHIGVARVNGTHEIELLESFVRVHHNRWALRRMAVIDPVELIIVNWPEGLVDERMAANNPEDDTAGTRKVAFCGRLWIERADFMVDPPKKFFRLSLGREVRLRAGYLVTCVDYETNLAGDLVRVFCKYDPATAGGRAPDGRQVKATIHWVSTQHALDGKVMLYDRLFTDPFPSADGSDPLESVNAASRQILDNAKLELALAETTPGEVVQFERLGYFALDSLESLTFHRTVGLRDEWRNIQKRSQQS